MKAVRSLSSSVLALLVFSIKAQAKLCTTGFLRSSDVLAVLIRLSQIIRTGGVTRQTGVLATGLSDRQVPPPATARLDEQDARQEGGLAPRLIGLVHRIRLPRVRLSGAS